MDVPVVLAVDTGFPDLGAALFVGGQLRRAAWIKVPALVLKPCRACYPRPCEHEAMPNLVVDLVDEMERQLGISAMPDGDPRLPTVTLVEWPKIFSKEVRGGRALFLLAGVSAAVLHSAASWGSTLYHFTPADWKGSKAKPLHQAETLAALRTEERLHLPTFQAQRGLTYRSDPLDAAGLGLWWLCRCRLRDLRMHGTASKFLPLVEPDRRKAKRTARVVAPRGPR